MTKKNVLTVEHKRCEIGGLGARVLAIVAIEWPSALNLIFFVCGWLCHFVLGKNSLWVELHIRM